MGAFDNILSFSEAARIWGLHESTLRKAVEQGKLVPDIDCKKIGTQWLITVDTMAAKFKGGYAPWEAHRARSGAPELESYAKSVSELEQNIQKLNRTDKQFKRQKKKDMA